jgi:murein DD-endopeptidase MepM/ murein hydrolase activator NlpD
MTLFRCARALRRAFSWLALAALCGAPGLAARAETVVEVAAFGVAAIPEGAGAAAEGRAAHDKEATRVTRGDTWAALFARLAGVEVAPWARALRAPELPDLLPGRYVRMARAAQPDAWRIDYLLDARSAYRIDLDRAGARVAHRLPDDDLRHAARRDEMKSSLFSATDAVGLPEEIALRLVEIFAEEVDFLRELRRGYRCALVYEMDYADGMARPGRILAAEFIQERRAVAAYYHELAPGEGGYFTASGMDINRVLRPDTAGAGRARKGQGVDAASSFRRSPLEFSRVTSAPSLARYHPILKEWRAHRGTDYAAPPGTRVKATADGEVHFAGKRGSYGNLVILRHYNRFTTFYGHLNGFAEGLGAGDRVRKGEVIGYVGMTGLATGPHLHYELHDALAPGVGDVPLVVRAIPEGQVTAFRDRQAGLRRQLEHAYRASMVWLE